MAIPIRGPPSNSQANPLPAAKPRGRVTRPVASSRVRAVAPSSARRMALPAAAAWSTPPRGARLGQVGGVAPTTISPTADLLHRPSQGPAGEPPVTPDETDPKEEEAFP